MNIFLGISYIFIFLFFYITQQKHQEVNIKFIQFYAKIFYGFTFIVTVKNHRTYEMKLEPRQLLQQRQELQLSLFQTQSLQILQMPTTDLVQYIQEEAMKNPCLEIEFKSIENEAEGSQYIDFDEQEQNPIDIINENTALSTSSEYELKDEEIDIGERKGESWEGYYSRAENLTDLSYNPDIDEWVESRFNNVRGNETLRSHLIKQLNIEVEDPQKIQIGESIIASINARGYFDGNIDEIAKEFNVSTEEVEEVLKIIQSFDPSGVGARDTRECLLIQIIQMYPENILLRKLVEEYYDEFIHRQITKIAKGLKIKPYEVEDLINLLKVLHPFPGHLFPETPDIIIPDVIVRINEDDKLVVELHDKHLPEIKIVEPVKKEQIKNLPQEEKEQIKKFKESAIRLIKCVDLRNSTLYKVAKEIVLLQEDFMRKGEEFLKPLTYKIIADRLGIHESTVSRCIAGKYMSTPQGTFEFRYFFSGGIKTNEGENELSSRTVKTIIKRIIDEEDKSKPLSDQQIAKIVQKQEGIKIARRTVSKYREEMNIPNAFERKVYSK